VAFERAARLEHGRVFDDGNQNAAALGCGLLGDAVDRGGDRLGAAAGEDDIAGREADEPRDALACFLQNPAGLAPLGMERGGVGGGAHEHITEGADRPGADRARCVVIQVDPVHVVTPEVC
jgi:hypothetical protein